MAVDKAGPGHRARTALELHARYFDPDGDEGITPRHSLRGMTALGLPWPLAAVLCLVVHVFLGYLTRRRATLNISVPDIARGKHPFNSGIFGDGGALNEAAFHALFQGPGTQPPRDRVTYAEFRQRLLRNKERSERDQPIASLVARGLSALEVSVLFCLSADCEKAVHGRAKRAMSRKTVRRFYEGRLFPLLARRRRMLAGRGAP